MGSVPANSHAVEIAPARTVPAGSKIGRPTIKSGHADIAARPPRRRHVRFSGSGRSAPPRETGLHHTAPSASACEARRRHPCAAFGAGFVEVEGTGTCVKIGGAFSVGVGGSVRSR